MVQWAIKFRQRRKMTLGDDIVAATAAEHGRVLLTHNTEDFRWINEIKLLDPLVDRP